MSNFYENHTNTYKLNFLRENMNIINKYISRPITTRIRTVGKRPQEIYSGILRSDVCKERRLYEDMELRTFIPDFLHLFEENRNGELQYQYKTQRLEYLYENSEDLRIVEFRQKHNNYKLMLGALNMLHNQPSTHPDTIVLARQLRNRAKRETYNFVIHELRFFRNPALQQLLPGNVKDFIQNCIAEHYVNSSVVENELDANNVELWIERALTRDNIKMTNWKEEKPEECPICCGECPKQTLSCGHYVCSGCVIKSKKTSCPCCRQEVDLDADALREIYRLTH